MTVFVMDGEMKRRCQVIKEYSEDPSHYCVVGEGSPGDDSNRVLQSGNVRAVLSLSYDGDRLLRIMSVSVSSGKLPAPLIVFTLAHMFGFRNADVDNDGIVNEPAKDWVFGPHYSEGTVMVYQAENLH